MLDRRRLRATLRSAYPWVVAPDVGPSTVDAGSCDRCELEPRVLATCGPVRWRYLGRRCVAEVGEQAWCEGHQDDGEAARAALAQLPAEADDVVWLWWVATGEVQLGELALTYREHPLWADELGT